MAKRQLRYSKGQRIGGRFLVHQALMGGMGEVYLCLDLEEMLPYALKTFQHSNPDLREIFKHEVASWIALEKHPNIVRCFRMEPLDNVPFMFLEWVIGEESKGTDLRGWLRHGPLGLTLALRFTIDIVRGLQHANQKVRGIVHRDLKPENVLVNQSKQAKITDFGLAKVIQDAKLEVPAAENGRHVPRYSNVGGTYWYMAPEQWLGGPLDARTDIYAVGCILYEMLTGKWLYNAHTVSELRTQHLKALIPSLNNGFPPAVKWILEGCLAKQLEGRFTKPESLLVELTKLYEAYSNESLSTVTTGEFTASDYNNRGVTFANLGQHERAITDYDRAISLDSAFAQAYSNRGASCHVLRQHQRAIADYERTIALDPTYATAYVNRGNIYADLEQHERAIADYDRAIQLDSTLAKAYCNRGTIYADLGQHERAIGDYNRAIGLDSNYAMAYYSRGTIYADLGQHERAIGDYNHAIQLNPTFASVYGNRGNSYADLGQHERAIADYARAIAIDPTDALAYYNRGNNYVSLGQHDLAIADYDRVVTLDPTLARAYVNKGVTLTKVGRFQEALISFKKATELGEPLGAKYAANLEKRLRQPPARPVVSEQKQLIRELVSLYQEIGETDLRQGLQENGLSATEIDQLMIDVKQILGGK